MRTRPDPAASGAARAAERTLSSRRWSLHARRVPGLGTYFLTVLLAAAALGTGCRPEPQSGGPALHTQIRASADRVRIGDAVRVDVVAEHPEHTGLQIEAPVPESITVLSRDRTEKRMGNGRMRTTFRYDLTAFVPGAYTALVGRASLSGGEGVSAVTTDLAGIVFHVESILAASGRDPLTEVWRDLPGLARGPRSRLPRLLWALPLVALIALGAGLFARRRGRTQAAEPVPPAAHEVALRELEKLRAEQWVERGEGETFIVRLSGIVRRYLEGRFDLRAPECTTEEFIRDAAQSSLLSSMHQQLTRSFLEQSDLVKFARWRPEAGTLQETFAAAERLVRETVPVSTGPEPAGEDGA